MVLNDPDLNECDKEPIHIPSAIQPYGFFLSVDPQEKTIIAVSSNIDLFFTFNANHILTQHISQFSLLLHEWINEQQDLSAGVFKIMTFEQMYVSTPFVVSMHRYNDLLIIEAEPASSADLFPDTLAQAIINETIPLTSASSIDELCHLGAIALQRISGFGRVMAYRFDEDFNGCVTAEANTPPMESYLDHHFPAGDIPAQARELYRTNLIRYIANATYIPVPIQNTRDEPIDMSRSTLRSVSPIHLEYLRNMDVSSSMSLSIIVNGKLWGLFACHHPSPLQLPYTVRHYCEMFIKLFNAVIQEKLSNEISSIFFRLKDRYTSLKAACQTLTARSSIHEAFSALGQSWMDAMESDGVCLLQENTCSVFGTVPSFSQISELSRIIAPYHVQDIFISHTLGGILSINSIKGILSIIISHHPHTEVIWFRKECIEQIKWAGNPDKTVLIDHSQRISPRKSFETFTIEQRGKSIPWRHPHVLAAEFYKEFGSIVHIDTMNRSLIRQNHFLIQQGKMAMMGEMIGAIAHQWKQPLNALSILLESLSWQLDKCDNDSKIVSEIKQKSMDKIAFMNETLETFRNFFRPDTTTQFFPLLQSVQEVKDQLIPQLHINDITCVIPHDETMIQGPVNEFKQIILNLLLNAYDALMKNHTKSPTIRCNIEKNGTEIYLRLCDNGGGIPADYLASIFDLHFSTKGEETGRGIGLYLSKLIMEAHFGGTIRVENTAEGTCFTLAFLSDKTHMAD